MTHDSLSQIDVIDVSIDLGDSIAPGAGADASAVVPGDRDILGVVGFTSGTVGAVPRLVRVESRETRSVRMVAENVTEHTISTSTPALVQVLVK